MTTTISKKLSANDIGINGAHQAGILVPKAKDILSFFPDLNAAIKNPSVPRASMKYFDSVIFLMFIM